METSNDPTQPTAPVSDSWRSRRVFGRGTVRPGIDVVADARPRRKRHEPFYSVYGAPERGQRQGVVRLCAPNHDPISDAYAYPAGTQRFFQAARIEAADLVQWLQTGVVASMDELRTLCEVPASRVRDLRLRAAGSLFDEIGVERVLLFRQAVWAEIQRLSSLEDTPPSSPEVETAPTPGV